MMMTAAEPKSSKSFSYWSWGCVLQAIATAKRLGAIVSATDVREASREQVESLVENF